MITFAPFRKSVALAKIDEATHSTFGIVTAEVEDADGEICDYASQKPYYREWADSQLAATTTAGQSPSMGNVRWQHSLEIAGKVIDIRYQDDARQIWLRTQPLPEKWPLIADGFVTGLSQAGQYVRRWCANCGADIARGNDCPRCAKVVPVKYCARITECSYVDRPAVPIATFTYVKANGQTELRKFTSPQSATTPAGWTWWDTDVWEDNGAILVPTGSVDDSTGFEWLASGEAEPVPSTPPTGVPAALMTGYDSDDSTGFE